jgi:hypothetical protein
MTPSASTVPGATATLPPALTSDQQQQLLSIVSSDARITNLTSGVTVASSKLATWNTGQGTLIGGVQILTLTQPATMDEEWRGINWADSAKSTYSVIVYTAKLSNVTRIDIWVDLQKGAVVGWSPNTDAKVEAGPTVVATVTE